MNEHQHRDPWDYQHSLMVASDQPVPQKPTLTKASLLYFALICEEAGETGSAVYCAFDRMPDSLRDTLYRICDQLTEGSREIRRLLENMPEFEQEVSEEDAVQLLDGTTDIAVVNCGFAIATGLPGPDAYAEVARSNLSKANSKTGKIEKTPDGKWIKGRDFFKPDLARVLREFGG